MDWSLLVLALVGSFFWWRHTKGLERAKVASARLERDTRLYQHIKAGMREYDWRRRDDNFWFGSPSRGRRVGRRRPCWARTTLCAPPGQ
jgi:hypothetical protein